MEMEGSRRKRTPYRSRRTAMAGLSGAPSRGEHWIFLSGVRVPDFPLAGTRRPFRPWLTPGTGHRMRSCGDRASFEERISPYAEFEIEIEENVDLRNGMIFAVACQGGRLFGKQ